MNLLKPIKPTSVTIKKKESDHNDVSSHLISKGNRKFFQFCYFTADRLEISQSVWIDWLSIMSKNKSQLLHQVPVQAIHVYLFYFISSIFSFFFFFVQIR